MTITSSKNLKDLANSLIIIVIVGWLFYIGAPIIMPLIFGLLFAIFILPVHKKGLKIFKYKWISIFVTLLIVLIPIILLAMLFSMQFLDIIRQMPSIENNIKAGFDQALNTVNDLFPFLKLNQSSLLSDNLESIISGPLKILSQGILSSSGFVLSIGLVFIYAFFILYYKDSFKNFLIYYFKEETRTDLSAALFQVKETVQAYVGGLGLVILILSILNSIGLYLIGINHPIFWGTLAGFLAIIPYIGTVVGGILPFLYAIATADHNWQPVAVIIYYGIIQQVEGNLITPKVVGDKVDINPLFAIIALVFFGTFWGIGGIILALPLISILRIIFEQFDLTKPIALLISTKIDNSEKKFKEVTPLED